MEATRDPRSTRPMDTAGPRAIQKPGRRRCKKPSHAVLSWPWSNPSTTIIPVGPVGGLVRLVSPVAGSRCNPPLSHKMPRSASRKEGADAPEIISSLNAPAPRHRPAEASPRSVPRNKASPRPNTVSSIVAGKKSERSVATGRRVRSESWRLPCNRPAT